MKTGNLLIVDDNPDVLTAAEIVLKKQFQAVGTESDPQQLGERLGREHFDVVLLDMNFQRGATSGREGFQWLSFIRERSPATQVILMTAYAGVDIAVQAMKQGAVDFIIKPWDNAKLLATVFAAYQLSSATREITRLQQKQAVLDDVLGREFQDIIGQSAALNAVLETVDKVAGTDANVLILGENGTGKELIARAIHQRSLRGDQSFINVDLGAIAESLFESELFGHKRGAFTDAKQDRPGRFELAHQGTLFLDEIGNLSTQAQAKLLGALESRTVTRVGADHPVIVDVRLICATNKALAEMVEDYRFRQDLLYRINTVEIQLPPLRERQDDILLLADYFAQHFARKYDKHIDGIHRDALTKLLHHHWPGNIRELKHTLERAVIMAENPQLTAEDFALRKPHVKAETSLNLAEVEKDTIRRALIKYEGNISKAAGVLGLGRATLYRKMAKYGL